MGVNGLPRCLLRSCVRPYAYHNGLVTLFRYSPWVKPISVYPSPVSHCVCHAVIRGFFTGPGQSRAFRYARTVACAQDFQL